MAWLISSLLHLDREQHELQTRDFFALTDNDEAASHWLINSVGSDNLPTMAELPKAPLSVVTQSLVSCSSTRFIVSGLVNLLFAATIPFNSSIPFSLLPSPVIHEILSSSNIMPRLDVNAESREGLLRSDHTYPLRPSLEQAYASTTGSEDRLDSLDLDAADRATPGKRHRWTCIPKRPPWSSTYTYEDNQDKSTRRPPRRRGFKHVFLRWRTLSVIVLILALGLITIVGSGALWVYKSAPTDGVGSFPGALERKLTF